jgi:hypothetical protein
MLMHISAQAGGHCAQDRMQRVMVRKSGPSRTYPDGIAELCKAPVESVSEQPAVDGRSWRSHISKQNTPTHCKSHNYRALISNSSKHTATYTKTSTPHRRIISNSSNEDTRYLSIIRRCLTSDNALPSFETCGIA